MSIAAAAGLHSRRRRLVAIMALIIAAAVAATLSAVFTQSRAEAHGATVFPGSRQFFCYYDAQTASGALDPYNEACQAAFDEVGPTPFYNWFGNLDSNGAGQTVGYIPDGQICDGGGRGPYDFSPFNDPGNWPRTHITSGDTVEWRFNNWAAHPGRFDLYITKPGWDPNSPIAWDDLEKFTTIQDPPMTGGAGSEDNYYYANITLPQRSGYHVIFTHWVRSDSTENFYACSDVVFDGGNGEITGINPNVDLPGNDGDVTNPDPDPTTDEPDDPTTDEPDDPTTDEPDPTDGTCTAEATVNSWGSGATVSIQVTNTGTATIGDWMIHWLWEPNSGITITNSWNTEISSMGDMEMAGPGGWNATIAAGQSVDFGFNVSGSLTSMPELECIPS